MQILLTLESVDENGVRSEPKTLVFMQEQITLGRAEENDVMLNAPSVSSEHATIIVKAGRAGEEAKLFVVDKGSSNGTFIEMMRISPSVETVIPQGKRLLIGNFIIQLRLVGAEDFKVQAASEQAAVNAGGDHEKGQISFDQELAVKQKIHEQFIRRMDLRRKDILALSEHDVRQRAQMTIERILNELRWDIPAGLSREGLIKEILDEALGLGPLEELLHDDTVSEIMVNRFDRIYIERGGKLQLSKYRFSSEQAVLGAIERIIAPIGRRIDESSPLVDARLKDGSRVNAVIRPLALQGPCITIRKFSKKALTVDDLVSYGSLSRGMAEFLHLAVEQRLNILISGGTGSGKTTLLNVIASFIPEDQRVITVEDAAELRLPREHIVAFETRPPNLEGKGAITIRDLVRNALRMRPDRIIVGECRGAEALDMLQAMNTGHDGSMTTGHANAPSDMIARLETMVLMAGMDLPVRAVREQIASAVHLVVQQTRFSCGSRRITAISEVVGMDYDEGKVALQDIFLFRQEGFDENGKTRGKYQATGYVPKFFRRLQEEGKTVNANVFSPDV